MQQHLIKEESVRHFIDEYGLGNSDDRLSGILDARRPFKVKSSCGFDPEDEVTMPVFETSNKTGTKIETVITFTVKYNDSFSLQLVRKSITVTPIIDEIS